MIMTIHWFNLAIQGKGPKGLNDRSGSHGSTLAQYIAKWSPEEEIEAQIAAGVAKGMEIDQKNASGWTPLTAAAAMGRVAAVKAFALHYSLPALFAKTTEEYVAMYHGHRVAYAAGLTAAETAIARLEQDKGASRKLRDDLSSCAAIVLLRMSEGGGG